MSTSKTSAMFLLLFLPFALGAARSSARTPSDDDSARTSADGVGHLDTASRRSTSDTCTWAGQLPVNVHVWATPGAIDTSAPTESIACTYSSYQCDYAKTSERLGDPDCLANTASGGCGAPSPGGLAVESTVTLAVPVGTVLDTTEKQRAFCARSQPSSVTGILAQQCAAFTKTTTNESATCVTHAPADASRNAPRASVITASRITRS
jgi:hypothetical protein